MKTKKLFLALAAVCAMGFTSCTNANSLINKLEKTDDPFEQAEILKKLEKFEDELTLEQEERITNACF